MPSRHQQFVHQENIRHFEAKLKTETDPAKRALIESLLSDERALLLPQPAKEAEDQDGPP